MTDRLTIEIDDAEVMGRLLHAVQALDRPDELMANIAAVLEMNVQRRFDAKVDPSGAAWSPIKPSTRKAYERKYAGSIPGTLLERTREMRNSLESRSGADFAELGFGNLIARYHEEGTRHMERRGLLTADPGSGELGADDRSDIEREVADFLSGLLGG